MFFSLHQLAAEHSNWTNSLPQDPAFVPIGVWLQSPEQAAAYRKIGINLYVGLWEGPTERQLMLLRDSDMHVIADQNGYARSLLRKSSSLLDPIVGWKLQDEPDNAQELQGESGDRRYGPPVTPAELERKYRALHAQDKTRPVYLNLGQGVAWDHWIGRGDRTNHPEDYPLYQKAGDILSFDIYPASASGSLSIRGELWRVAYGTSRLREWTPPEKPVWSFIECTRIYGAGKATTHEVRAMVWMAFIHGATGIQYFVHEFAADGSCTSTSALLADPEMSRGVAEINAEIHRLAAVINSPTLAGRLQAGPVHDSQEDSVWNQYKMPAIAAMLKEHDGDLYLFAVRMRNTAAEARFAISKLGPGRQAEVIGSPRTIPLQPDGTLTDQFPPWGATIYRIRHKQ